MDYEKEISFGAFDSELMRQEIYIPEGFEATIDGNKIILKKIENEDERIRKGITSILEHYKESGEVVCPYPFVSIDEALAWLEKQANHANFRNKIQIGDKVTRNRDGVLVNLSQLNRVAKKDENQGESYTKKDVDDAFVEGMALAKDELEKQKPVWSEDDEKMLNSIIEDFGDGKTSNMLQEYWLKSLKERIGG